MGSVFCCWRNQNVEPELEIPRFYGEKLHINNYNYHTNRRHIHARDSAIQYGDSQ